MGDAGMSPGNGNPGVGEGRESLLDLRNALEAEREKVRKLSAELSKREAATSYEIAIWSVADWRSAWRGQGRREAISEAKRISAERLGSPIGQDAYVRLTAQELVWDNSQEVSDLRGQRIARGESTSLPGIGGAG